MDVDRETEMNLSQREIRVLLLYEFLLRHKATEATNNIQYNLSKVGTQGTGRKCPQ
jgi:hypothetical protein